MTPAVAFVVGPPEHGVVRHARGLAGAAGWPIVDRIEQVPRGAWVVLDVTDRLWGSTADVSGPAIASVLESLRGCGSRIAVALHDVPFDGDGAVFARRAEVYRSIVQRSDAVFVCSEVERRRLVDLGLVVPRVAVLPLPVAAPAPRRAAPATPEAVTVLGYLYPGKGHDEVLAAMADLPPQVPLICAGRASDGHDDLVRALTAGGRPVRVTGYLSDADLTTVLQTATVPVAPNRVVSASASLATWWAHGRRPLAPDTAYSREVGTDATLAYYDADLPAALRRAFDAPASTWLADGVVAGPSLAAVVTARNAWLARWSA